MILIFVNTAFLYTANWVEIHGVKYCKGSIVLHHHCLFPVFIKIEDFVIMPNSDVVLICRRMHTLRFWIHAHSYEVMVLNQISLTNYTALLDYDLLNVYVFECLCF